MRGLAITLAVVAALWLVVVGLTALLQRQLIYLPSTASPEAPHDVQEVHLVTEDGQELAAWFLPVDDPASTVLVTPGNAGHRGLRLPLARGLNARGHAVLLLDYRGFGGNLGTPSERGLLRDARAARAHLDGRPDVEDGRIAYLGESIGTGVAAALASEIPPMALVLRSPFPELADVGASAYPFLPVRTLLRERFEVLEHVQRFEGPVLVVAGDADGIVPPELSRRVAAAAGTRPVIVEGAGHNDLELLSGDRYLDAVDEHLRAATEGSAQLR